MKHYAEIIESVRFKGTRVLKVISFDSRAEMEDFVSNYNVENIDAICDVVPDVYTIAQTASVMNIRKFEKGELQ